jgi:general secretion pathway protein K
MSRVYIKTRCEQGIALVIVLWIVVLLSIMAASFAYSMRTETTLTTFAMERAQARALAEAGVNYATQKLLFQVDPDNPWPIEGSVREWPFAGGTAYISVVDSSGKFDLNHADRILLAGLFTVQGGIAEEEVDTLLDAIEDWRDPDDIKRLNGAEEDEYLAVGRDVGPKNAPFESVEELQQVLGVTTALYEKIADFITVSGHKGVNPEAASLEVLSTIPDVDPQLIMDYVQQRSENIATGEPSPPPPPLGEYLSQAKGLAYHININARLDTGTQITIKAVVTQARRPGQVFHIISWNEG